MSPAALGLRAVRGGAVAVGVAVEGGEPRVVLSTFLATAAEGDRLAFEPYHVAAEMAGGASGDIPAAVVEAVSEGRRRQAEMAAEGLEALLRALREGGCEPAVVALLINRAGWVTDLLRYSLSMPDHPPVAEGLAVREALRAAFGRCGAAATEIDEKGLPELASALLGLTSAALEARLKELGSAVGPPWRKEQKLACLAAWVAVTKR
jgi:hypothetical protein